jgi:hypothetical protein
MSASRVEVAELPGGVEIERSTLAVNVTLHVGPLKLSDQRCLAHRSSVNNLLEFNHE